MDKPKIAALTPQKVQVEKGKDYFWCSCGKSKNQPYCDGSHRGSSFKPMTFQAEQDGEVFLCRCKFTKNPPYCDGTHAKLSKDNLEDSSKQNSTESALKTPLEPHLDDIRKLTQPNIGAHGDMAAMGVPITQLPKWDDLQILVAQLARQPLDESQSVESELIIGQDAKIPLALKIPLFVSDMSFGSLSYEAKVSLAKGAELAGTGICSGEGGMLPEEQAENSRYLYELGSAKFGFDLENVKLAKAFHFKAGQAAKTGIGGHLPGNKVTQKIAEVRRIPQGKCAISPPSLAELKTPKEAKLLADEVREATGGIPIGFKLSANHIEDDLEFALKASADYIILDGRGGGTGAAPAIFRDNISVPTIPALARARKYLDKHQKKHVTLIITGGLRVPSDFIKALCLGADGIALSNAAIQSIGCIGARICNTNLCPSGIATQDPTLRSQIKIDDAAQKLAKFFNNSVNLMSLIARACGYNHLNQFNKHDLTTWKKEMASLSGVRYSGVD